jgi:hypothetical protein
MDSSKYATLTTAVKRKEHSRRHHVLTALAPTPLLFCFTTDGGGDVVGCALASNDDLRLLLSDKAGRTGTELGCDERTVVLDETPFTNGLSSDAARFTIDAVPTAGLAGDFFSLLLPFSFGFSLSSTLDRLRCAEASGIAAELDVCCTNNVMHGTGAVDIGKRRSTVMYFTYVTGRKIEGFVKSHGLFAREFKANTKFVY